MTGAVSTRARQQEPSREGPRIDQASAAAGDKDVVVMGGGDVIRQCVDSGLADELIIHLAPIVLGSGTPLLADCRRRQLVQRDVRVSPTATQLTYALHS